MLKKFLAALGTLALAIGMTVAVAAPADATHPTVTGSYACNSASGSFDITWQVSGDPAFPDAIATIVSQSVDTSPTLVGSTVQAAGYVEGTQSGVAAGTTVDLSVSVQWTTHADGDLVSSSGTVAIPEGTDCATADATASVTVTAATCSAPSILVYDIPVNATFTEGTPDGATGATTGVAKTPYSVTATADAGHSFADGHLTMVISGELDAQLTGSGCVVPPACISASAVTYTYDPLTNSGVITVADVADSTHALCAPFWVTATSWKFVSATTIWPQMIDVVQKLGPISAPGTYEYAAAVSCGQGDIYASFDGQPEPSATLDGPANPFGETFLDGMGFSGPSPMFTHQDPSCTSVKPVVSYELGACYQAGESPDYTSLSPLTVVFDNSASTVPVTFTIPNAPDLGTRSAAPTSIVRTVPAGAVVRVATTPISDQGGSFVVLLDGVYTVTIPDFKLIIATYDGCLESKPGDPSHTDEVCTDTKKVLGSITVGFETGLVYGIDGPGTAFDVSPVTQKTTSGLPAGDYLVTVRAAPGYTLTGASSWPLTVTIASVKCDLPTDALVTPTARMTNLSCSAVGGYTLDANPGVIWTVNGKPANAGSYPVTTTSTIVVTATPNAPKYGFEDTVSNPAVLTFTFTAPSKDLCDTQLKTLAFTGVSSSLGLMLAGGVIFIGIGGLLLARRRFSRN